MRHTETMRRFSWLRSQLSGTRRPTPDVRMFCGWADSVLWMQSGPVDYDELGLPANLERELTRWDSTWSYTAHPDHRDATLRESFAHHRQGRRLAQQVADALGREILIDLRMGNCPVFHHYRGRGDALSPHALAAVRRRQAEDAEQKAHIDALRKSGADLEWRAVRGVEDD